MALLSWNSSYSVGIKSMDGQHTKLFGMLNDLHAAMMSGKTQGVTGKLLHKLVDYTREHFTAEEAMMASAKFPGLDTHRIRHRNLSRQVEEFVVRFEKGESAINIQLLNFLRDWLTNHIQKEDKEYGPWLNKGGMH
jgi:hemerythrin-like metal-binding protein